MSVNFGIRLVHALLSGLLFFAVNSYAGGYAQHPQAASLIQQLIDEHGFDTRQLTTWFEQAERQQAILDSMARPAEKTLSWARYQQLFLTPARIEKGVQFRVEHRDLLARVEEAYGVPAEIIVAILGIETNYGSNMGAHRIMDVLATLAFDYPPRQDFFSRELKQFLLLVREQQRDPLSMKGSYAGAMGMGQFMPSSYRAYAVDFDGDGKTDIWANNADAVASVANYFAKHGWRRDEAVVVRARAEESYDRSLFSANLKPAVSSSALQAGGLTVEPPLAADMPVRPMRLEGVDGDEFWIGLQNFYVITRYNHSELYAMAAYQLSLEIERLTRPLLLGER